MVASEDLILRFLESTGDLERGWDASRNGHLLPSAFFLAVKYPVERSKFPAGCYASQIVEMDCEWRELPQVGREIHAFVRNAELFSTKLSPDAADTYLYTEVEYRTWANVVLAVCKTTVRCLLQAPNPPSPIGSHASNPSAPLSKGFTDTEGVSVYQSCRGAYLPSAVRKPVPSSRAMQWLELVGHREDDADDSSSHRRPSHIENGTLRFAFVASMLSNWLQDHGQLRRLKVLFLRPTHYAETICFSGKIIDLISRCGGESAYSIEISGINSLGEEVTRASAEVVVRSNFKATAIVSSAVGQSCQPQDLTPSLSQSVLDDIAAQAIRNGGRTAISSEQQSVTYDELYRSAYQIGAGLCALGVDSNSIVAIRLPRSIDAVLAVLGVMQSGAGYLFIDHEYPLSTAQRMLRAATCLLSIEEDSDFESSLLSFTLESAWKAGRNRAAPGPGAVAYRMFTSGSAGQPKCVEVGHRDLALSMQSLDPLGYNADDVCLHTASFSFSASVRQLFAPLRSGALIVLMSKEAGRDPRLRLEVIARHGVTIWDTTPSALRQTCDFLVGSPYSIQESFLKNSSLRQVQITGETLPGSVVQCWMSLPGKIPLINLYSQTETVGTVCFAKITSSSSISHEIAPVGRPLAGNAISIRDSSGIEAAVGEIGAIYVQSNRLASVVSENESGLFPSNPVASTQVGWYATGDRGLITDDGQLVVVGRQDGALNVRGHRISPAEIEAMLLAALPLTEAAIVPQQSADGTTKLHAFLSTTASLTRSCVRACLPSHMQPDCIEFLSSLPRLPSGKIDRQALKTRLHPAAETQSALESLTAMEQVIAKIWQTQGSVAAIDSQSSFFECGGDSLAAVRVIAAIERTLGYSLSVREFYEAPTLEKLAGLIQTRKTIGASRFTTLHVAEQGRPLFFIAGLGGHSYQFLRLTKLLQANSSCYGLEYPDHPLFTVQEIASYMIATMREVQPSGPYRLAGHSFGGRVCFEIARQLQEASESVSFLGLLDASAPVHTSYGEIQRAVRQGIRIAGRAISTTNPKQFVKKFKKRATGNVEYWRMAMPQFASAAVAERTYKPKVYSGSAVLFRAAQKWDKVPMLGKGPCLGWEYLIMGGLDVVQIPGNHTSILGDPEVHTLASALKAKLVTLDESGLP